MNPLVLVVVASLATFTLACSAQSPAGDSDHRATHASTAAPAAGTAAPAPNAAAAVRAPKLQADLRALWHGHVVATRDYAMAVKADDRMAASQAADGVVANAKSIAGAVAGFYGAPAGEEMLRLLGEHWGAVQAMTDAERAGDDAGVQKAMDNLVANAAQIASFLAGANPNLAADAVNGLLVAHGGHHAAQIEQIMAGDMTAEADTWAAMQAHMDVIADALANAIALQFPDKAA